MSEQKFGTENSTQFVPAKCTACGGELEVDPKQETAVCRYCGETFVVSKAVNNYNVEHNTYNTKIVNERKGDMESMLNFISDREDKKYARAKEQKAERSKRNKTLLWALGWIFIFPVPLTILMLRNKKLADKVRYGIIAAAWVVYILLLVITQITGDKDSDKAADVSSETSSAAESKADDIDLDAIVDKLKDSEAETKQTEAPAESKPEKETKATKETKKTEKETKKTEEEPKESEPSLDDIKKAIEGGDYSLVSADFKEVMDGYEAFFDQYIEFMNKYNSGEGDQLEMMNDYMDMVSQETEWMDKINAIDEKSLTVADDAYYIIVTTRVQKKLADASL